MKDHNTHPHKFGVQDTFVRSGEHCSYRPLIGAEVRHDDNGFWTELHFGSYSEHHIFGPVINITHTLIFRARWENAEESIGILQGVVDCMSAITIRKRHEGQEIHPEAPRGCDSPGEMHEAMREEIHTP